MASGRRAKSTPIQPTPERMCRINTVLRHRGGRRRGRRSSRVVVVMAPDSYGGALGTSVPSRNPVYSPGRMSQPTPVSADAVDVEPAPVLAGEPADLVLAALAGGRAVVRPELHDT